MALTDKLTAIAEAIRTKTGKSDPMTLSQMPTEIAGISGGGGSGELMPACRVTIMEMKIEEPLYYRGESFQPLPAEISGYPYALILQKNDGTVRLWLSENKFSIKTNSDGLPVVSIPANNIYFTHSAIWCPGGAYMELQEYVINGHGVWNLWWSNADIPLGSEESAEIGWQAAEPQTQQPGEASRFFYNGVRLPKLPEDLLAAYPYAWIRKNNTSGYYDLLVSNEPFYRKTAAIYDGGNTQGLPWYRVEIAAAETAAGWTDNTGTHTYASWGLDDARTVLWSNHDMSDGSSTASTLYFYATQPVPEA